MEIIQLITRKVLF